VRASPEAWESADARRARCLVAMKNIQVDILLVEDNQDDCDLALRVLRRERLVNNVFVVRDGEQALNFLFCSGPYAERRFEDIPKLVLLDLKLPKVDGLEVLRQMKSDPRTRLIPVAVLTSSKEERDLAASHNLGASCYLQKPLDFTQLSQMVKSMGLFWLLINERPASKGVADTTVQVKG
jgi:two-component system, response regulator